jgi:DNA polymerase V
MNVGNKRDIARIQTVKDGIRFSFAIPAIPEVRVAMSLIQVEWACDWPLILPYFDGSVPAGFPSPAEDYLETPLDLSEYLIENKAATFMMRVDGDSMKDAGILDGDLLVVDRAAKPVNGSVVIVAVNGEYTVKRLRRCSDCVWLEPANPRYQPIRVGIGEELHVFGVVRHAIHTLR